MMLSSRRALAACLAAFAAARLDAANLLVNPSFQSDASGWVVQFNGSGAYGGWQPTIGRNGGGGLRLTANMPGNLSFAAQCVDIAATTIDAHIHVSQNYAPSRDHYGSISVSTFGIPGCGATYLSNTRATAHVLADGWVLHRIDGLELPPQTRSVMLIATTTGDAGSTSLNWDEAALGPSGTTGVTPLPSNLLLNPEFHFSLFHWTVNHDGGGYVVWHGDDGEPSPGSIAMQRWSGPARSATQCVRLPGGAIDAYVLSDGATDDPARLGLQFHADATCNGAPIAAPATYKAPVPGAWTLHYLLDYTPPAGSVSARVQLLNDGTGLAVMDHAAFGAAGSIGAPPANGIGGVVSGLVGDRVQLRLNGDEALDLTADGPFEFATRVLDGGSYAVTLEQAPTSPTQTCSVSHGNGTVAGADVDTVRIDCEPPRYRVGGTVSGLVGHGLLLQLNGADTFAMPADGSFAFTTEIPDGGNYLVTVQQQPAGPVQVCNVGQGVGTISGAHIDNVTIDCDPPQTYRLSGTVSGLVGHGLSLRLNTAEVLPVFANGSFSFDTGLVDGAPFAVTVQEQPVGPAQTCTVSGGNGIIVAADVDSVEVRCHVPAGTNGVFADGFE